MIGDGQAPLNKDEFHLLLESILPLQGPLRRGPVAETARRIAAAPVIAEYAIAGIDRAANHYARSEAYTMLACHILGLAERHRLALSSYQDTLHIVEAGLDRAVKSAAEEAFKLDVFGQGSAATDPIIAPFRATLVAGLLAAHSLWVLLGGRSEWLKSGDALVTAEIMRSGKRGELPSESFVPALFLASSALRCAGEISTGDQLFDYVLHESVQRKDPRTSSSPLWDPYLAVEEALLASLGEPGEIVEKHRGDTISYTAWPLILLAAKRLQKSELQRLWYSITGLQFAEMGAEKVHHRVVWRNERGKLSQRMVPRPMRWSELLAEARGYVELPRPFRTSPHWLPFFLLVYPHRFNADLVVALDREIELRLAG